MTREWSFPFSRDSSEARRVLSKLKNPKRINKPVEFVEDGQKIENDNNITNDKKVEDVNKVVESEFNIAMGVSFLAKFLRAYHLNQWEWDIEKRLKEVSKKYNSDEEYWQELKRQIFETYSKEMAEKIVTIYKRDVAVFRHKSWTVEMALEAIKSGYREDILGSEHEAELLKILSAEASLEQIVEKELEMIDKQDFSMRMLIRKVNRGISLMEIERTNDGRDKCSDEAKYNPNNDNSVYDMPPKYFSVEGYCAIVKKLVAIKCGEKSAEMYLKNYEVDLPNFYKYGFSPNTAVRAMIVSL